MPTAEYVRTGSLTDIGFGAQNVRFVPQADMGRLDASCWLVRGRNASQVASLA